MKKDFENLTRRETAQALGKSEGTIGKWFAAGAPRKENGRYNLPELVTWREKAIRGDRPSGEKLDAATLRFRKARARKIELELAEKTGELVRRDVAARVFRGSILIAKTRLMALPAEVGNRLSGSIDHETIAVVTDTMRRSITGALRELAAAREVEHE